MNTVIERLQEYGSITEKAYAAISQIVAHKQYKKGDFILREDKVCQHIGFIEKGMTRNFYYKDGKDITTTFAYEEDPCLSMYSFISQKPSLESIEALEDCVIWSISYQQLQDLYQRFPSLNLIGRLLTEEYYIMLEDHTRALKHLSSKERYVQLMEDYPDIIQRVPLTHIASYLGMTKENLSRIRRI